MLVSCAFSCAKLEYAKERYNRRCPKPDDYTAALPAGQLHATFDRIMREFPELEPERISEDPPVRAPGSVEFRAHGRAAFLALRLHAARPLRMRSRLASHL